MDQILAYLPAIFAAFPVLTKVGAIVIGIDLALKAVVTSIVAIWQAAVMAVQAIALVPGAQGLQSLADKMKLAETTIEETEGKILPWLDRVSSFPLPTAKPQTPQV